MRIIMDVNGYKAIFDESTGLMVRLNKCSDDFLWKKNGPEILDISITNYCEKNCDFCYRESNNKGIFMGLELYKKIISEAKSIGVLQVALGGGNPNQHPNFIDFLKLTRENKIIPSYTTNGQGMSNKILMATKKYAGAIAVSWYKPYDVAISLIERCNDLEIPVNIHFVLDNDSIQEANNLLMNEVVNKVNAIVFLNYKPVGRVKRNILRTSSKLIEFLDFLTEFSKCKIGFDSCMISHLKSCKDKINLNSVDYCEAGRYSAFISEEGYMYPCSFMCGANLKGENLKESSISKIWKYSPEFTKIREFFSKPKNTCKNCNCFSFCHGGCPCFPINCL